MSGSYVQLDQGMVNTIFAALGEIPTKHGHPVLKVLEAQLTEEGQEKLKKGIITEHETPEPEHHETDGDEFKVGLTK